MTGPLQDKFVQNDLILGQARNIIYSCCLGCFEVELPIVMFHLTNPKPSVEEIKEYFTLQDQIFSQCNTPFVFVADTSPIKSMFNSEIRTLMSNSIVEIEQKHGKKMLGVFLIAKNQLTKLLIKLVNYLNPPIVPQTICASRQMALTEAQAILESNLVV